MSLSALQVSAYLHHLHIGSENPARLAAFYTRVMNMESAAMRGGAYCVRGPARRLLVSSGSARTLLHAGFAVRDEEGLAGLRARAEGQGLSPRDFETFFFKPGGFGVTDADGNVIVFGLAAPDFLRRGLVDPWGRIGGASRR